ncbi:MAG: SWIB/MDM2 domain-containing protein [Polaromonas sp.]|nr:SWIB/MDM2 domain-containing protein [Polaromonas sp.]
MATAKKAPAKKAAPAQEIAVVAAPAAPVAAPKAAAKKVAAKKVAAAPEAPVAPAEPAAKKRTPNAAFMKALTLSPELSAVVGKAPLPRTEIVKQLWVYIKSHDLQDKTNKRMINADKKLLAVFGKPQVSMFEMAGLIGKHIVK